MSELNKEMEWIFKSEEAVLQEAEEKLLSESLSSESILLPYSKLIKEYKKLLKQNVKLVSLGDAEHKYLLQIQSELKSILDNTGQGIFTTDENLCIHSKYSAECVDIFGQQLENKRFTDIIRPYNSEESIDFIEQVLNPMLMQEDECCREPMLTLLPEEIYFQDKILSMVCKVICSEGEPEKSRFLFLLTDITEKKQLESEMLEKQRFINTIIKIVSDNYLFKSCAKEFLVFLSSEEERLHQTSCYSQEELSTVFRKIHTFKGHFSIFELEEMVYCLDNIEKALGRIISAEAFFDTGKLKQILEIEALRNVFEKSISVLRSIIGDSFFEFYKDEVIIERKNIEALLSKIYIEGQPLDEYHDITLKALCQIDVKDLLRNYPEYTLKLGERNGKSIKPFTIKADSCIYVDEKRFSAFTKALVHVFRNAVIHGIEEPETRMLEGKAAFGSIDCRLWEQNDFIYIEISDDGKGIEAEKIIKKALEMGIINTVEPVIKDDSDLMNILCTDGFSTTEKPDQYSGRGEGLAAVKYELELLEGTAYIKTTPKAGTVFGFKIKM